MKLQRKIRAVLFDLDGVLIESFVAWFHQFNDTLKYFGHKQVSKKTFRKHWGQSTKDDVRIFMPERSVDEVRQYFADHYHEYSRYLKVNPNAKDILGELKRMGLRLGCVTNSHRDIVQTILSDTRLKRFFQVVITADDIENPKPAPDMLLVACKLLKVSPAQTVFLGDTKTDLIAGKLAGCIVVGYRIKSKIQVKNIKDFLAAVANIVPLPKA